VPAVEIYDSERDAADWVSLLERSGPALRDIYFRPEYGALYCSQDVESKLFTYREGDAAWVYAFLLQKLPTEYRDITGSDSRDIETPYGYGGPVSNCEDSEFYTRANSSVQEWCAATGVVAEFVRFHPLAGNQNARRPYISPLWDRGTVSLDLTGNEPIITAFDGNARNMVKRFEREEATIEETKSIDDFERFVEIYQKTMHRVSAGAFYYFDPDHFDRLRRLTLGSAKLSVVKLGGRITAGAIFLTGCYWLHYHLSATDPEYRVPGATNALIAHAAQQGHQCGLKRMHLGGGQSDSPDDRLLKFKHRMSTDKHSFWIGKYVHNEKAYSDICKLWRDRNPDQVADYGNRVLCYRFASPAPETDVVRTQTN
jgi:hypothetical protein